MRTIGDYKEAWPQFGSMLKQKLRKVCRRQLIFDRLPIIGWARGYQLSYVYHDILAGITVGLTAIPQGIAYGVVAGLEPQVLTYQLLKCIYIVILNLQTFVLFLCSMVYMQN